MISHRVRSCNATFLNKMWHYKTRPYDSVTPELRRETWEPLQLTKSGESSRRPIRTVRRETWEPLQLTKSGESSRRAIRTVRRETREPL